MPEATVYYHGEPVVIDDGRSYTSGPGYTGISWAHIILFDGTARWVMQSELTEQPEQGRAG